MNESDERNVPGGADERPDHSRDKEATSKETLSDVEEGEKVSTGRETGSPTETSSPGPSPDSAHGGGGRADGSETGGPM
jgi:hypothetical protein